MSSTPWLKKIHIRHRNFAHACLARLTNVLLCLLIVGLCLPIAADDSVGTSALWLASEAKDSLYANVAAAFWLLLILATTLAVGWLLYMGPALVLTYLEHVSPWEVVLWEIAVATVVAIVSLYSNMIGATFWGAVLAIFVVVVTAYRL